MLRAVSQNGGAGVLCLLSFALLAATASCERSKPDAVSAPEAEFKRHLRLGIEQLRRNLPESAAAEFKKCARIRRDDPDLLFHRARLMLLSERGDAATDGAIALLKRVLAGRADSVAASRLLAELEFRRGNRNEALAHWGTVARAYGQIGAMEMESLVNYLGGRRALKMPPFDPEAPRASDYRDLTRAFKRLRFEGAYAPSEAVPIVEKLIRRYDQLAVVRLSYAKNLLLQRVRVNYTDRPDLPLMSTQLIVDHAQSHLERVFDQSHPYSPIAREALFLLSRAAIEMADYDEAVILTDILLGGPGIPEPFGRRLLQQKALARFKQAKYSEAIRLLEASLPATDAELKEELSPLWLLHLSRERAGKKPTGGEKTFRFRSDLALPGSSTPLVFEDVAPRLRIDKLDGLGPSAWGDYDRDGDFDLYVSGGDSYGALYRNDGKIFTDVSREAGLFHVQSGFSSTFVDYDNNAWPDLYIGRDGWNGPASNSLYRNNGDGAFTDVTEKAGIDHPGASFVHAWSDVDRDGDLDLCVAGGITGSGDTNALYRNLGDGTFADVTGRVGLKEPSGIRTIGLAFGDYDRDGWPDLFVSGYRTLNRLYRNRGDGTFEEVAKEAGVDGASHVSQGYVCFFVDYDNDTYPDILRTTLAPWNDALLGISAYYESITAQRRDEMLKHAPKLYRNNGDGTFTDVSIKAGLLYPVGVMGANVGDLDNDGYVDFYFGTGDPKVERMEPDRFYRNEGDGTFTEMTFAVGLGNIGKGHGITLVDLDGDGDLEIYAPEGGFVHGDPWPNALYLNKQTTGNQWLHVDLEGVKSNRDGVDTRLVLAAGDLRILREVKNGEGFGSSNSATVEFGLGAAQKVDRLEVYWPSGEVQTFEDLPAKRRIFIREGEPWTEWRPPRRPAD